MTARRVTIDAKKSGVSRPDLPSLPRRAAAPASPSFVTALAAWASVVALVGAASGCSSSSSDPAPAAVTLDLDASCSNRAAWQASGSPDCSSCLVKVVLNCDCSHVGYEGKCQAVSTAKLMDADCSKALDDCVSGCSGDCRCEGACYAGHDACRARATDLNSCVVQACESSCR